MNPTPQMGHGCGREKIAVHVASASRPCARGERRRLELDELRRLDAPPRALRDEADLVLLVVRMVVVGRSPT
jgi:hypothetical protein